MSDSIIPDGDYVVIDSSITSVIFDLGNEEDSIVFVAPDSTLPIADLIVAYPSPYPAPPEEASVSRFYEIIGM